MRARSVRRASGLVQVAFWEIAPKYQIRFILLTFAAHVKLPLMAVSGQQRDDLISNALGLQEIAVTILH